MPEFLHALITHPCRFIYGALLIKGFLLLRQSFIICCCAFVWLFMCILAHLSRCLKYVCHHHKPFKPLWKHPCSGKRDLRYVEIKGHITGWEDNCRIAMRHWQFLKKFGETQLFLIQIIPKWRKFKSIPSQGRALLRKKKQQENKNKQQQKKQQQKNPKKQKQKKSQKNK